MQGDNDEATDAAVDELKRAFAESALPAAAVPQRTPRAYRSIAGLTRWLVALVALQVAAAAGNFVAMALMRAFLDEQERAPFLVAKRIVLVAGPTIALGYLAALVLFCCWVYRAYANLVPLGAPRPRFSPGWAVGYFFIPLVMLVRGLQVMRDLWIESQPLPVERSAPALLERRAPLVGWWWAMCIINMLASRSEHSPPHWTRDEWLAHNTQLMIGIGIDIAAAVLFIAVVRGIARRQREQWDDLVRRQPVPPRTDLLR